MTTMVAMKAWLTTSRLLCCKHYSVAGRPTIHAVVQAAPSSRVHVVACFSSRARSGCRDQKDDSTQSALHPTTTDNAATDDTSNSSSSSKKMRLHKWLAHETGWCSRRQAEDWIARGWIRVNGQVADNGGGAVFVTPGVDRVTVHPDARRVAEQLEARTILLHKPLGVLSAQPEDADRYTLAVKLLTAERHHGGRNGSGRRQGRDDGGMTDNPFRQGGWKVAGRLDVNSTGLLVLTQSPVVAQRLVSPPPHIPPVEKEYLVRLDRRYNDSNNNNSNNKNLGAVSDLEDCLARLRQGISDNGELMEVVDVRQLHSENKHDRKAKQNDDDNKNNNDTIQLKFTLNAGKYRHIRRMCAAVGLTVKAIKRVRIGNVVLGSLPVGTWRYLRQNETFF